ncbi:Calcineurin-like phosphoesterase [Sulfitobacter sp. THAF37]|uniref:metallophosphoesterase family protein n=1 Tax=Sulfitobacter sp. THAF37 TaxID=2587855 RepID=UPI001267EF86|nr:metallophosphoesterase [Sulfitobacter sp. THAF37]QFT58198.1 Calcineurin-like phosphoesterase [Sulfitobacter sp. THAF37]
MTRLVHLSDLHFGKDRADLIQPLLTVLENLQPDHVAISGDLTQRARSQEYESARAFIDRIDAPVLCVPGNHDIPIHRPLTRLFRPFGNYRKYISSDLTPSVETAEMVMVGLNTVDRFQWQAGRLSALRLRRACTAMGAAPAHKLRVLVVHHPLEHPEGVSKKPIPGAAEALERLIGCGADLILSGHLHLWHAGEFAHRAGEHDRRNAVQLHAGTSLSSRVRGEPNDFNVIDILDRSVQVARQSFDEKTGAFETTETRQFNRASDISRS